MEPVKPFDCRQDAQLSEHLARNFPSGQEKLSAKRSLSLKREVQAGILASPFQLSTCFSIHLVKEQLSC